MIASLFFREQYTPLEKKVKFVLLVIPLGSKFFSLFAYKAERAGRRVVELRLLNTSKSCASSDCIVENLKDGIVYLPLVCGWEADRDYNASLNILNVGLAFPNARGENLYPVIGYRSSLDKTRKPVRKGGGSLSALNLSNKKAKRIPAIPIGIP